MELTTKELSEALSKREGVSNICIDEYEKVKIITEHHELSIVGPMIILINQD